MSPRFVKRLPSVFPEQAQELNAALDKRLAEMRRAHENDTKEKKEHLEGQILPGIAAYETLQTVMPKEEARKTVHDYVEQRAWKLRAIILKLMRVPGALSAGTGLVYEWNAQDVRRNGGVRWRRSIRRAAAFAGSIW